MKPVKICLSRPKKFMIGAWAIMKYQGMTWKDPRSYSHILVMAEDSDVEELILQASHGLVHSCDKDVFLSDNLITKTYLIPKDYVDMVWLKKQLGKKYGYFQLIRIAIKYLVGFARTGNGDKKFICSEYIGKGLKLSWVDDYTEPKKVSEYLDSIEIKEN